MYSTRRYDPPHLPRVITVLRLDSVARSSFGLECRTVAAVTDIFSVRQSLIGNVGTHRLRPDLSCKVPGRLAPLGVLRHATRVSPQHDSFPDAEKSMSLCRFRMEDVNNVKMI